MAESDHIDDPPEPLCTLERSNNFQSKCSKGCTTGRNKQIHHILPCTTLNLRKADITEARKDYAQRCLNTTKWDINASDNLIGLPLKPRYKKSNGKNPVNLPCHDVDHGPYIDQCRQYLKTNIWNKLNKKKKAHKLDVKTILSELKTATTFHEGKLRAIGILNGGTMISWQKRLEPGWLNKWYKPFSMVTNSTPRRPPGNTDKLSNLFKVFL
jgi:hypothetical protein